MICPNCEDYLYRVPSRSVLGSVFSEFAKYSNWGCRRCSWQGSMRNVSHDWHDYGQRVFGWVMGIVLAIGIAYFCSAGLRNSTFDPAQLSASLDGEQR